MKKILQVHGGMERAGTEAVIMNWYRNINREKMQFDFTTTFKNECAYDKEIEGLGGNILYLPPRAKVGIIRHFIELYKLIKNNGNYDVVHSHMNFHGGLVALTAKLAGVKKIICHAHNTQEEVDGIKRKIEISILRILILAFADELVACSDQAGKFIFGKKREVKVINNAIDTNKFNPKELELNNQIKEIKTEYGLDDVLVIGHIGRFSKQKNHEFILSILSRLKVKEINFKMIFIGDGELKDEIILKSKKLNICNNILFMGLQDNVDEWLNIMDVFIFPSLYEGLGVVLIEAQGTGVPCIASDNVPKDVDLGLGLVNFLNINRSEDDWVNTILDRANTKILDAILIKNQIVARGYDLEENIKVITELYGK